MLGTCMYVHVRIHIYVHVGAVLCMYIHLNVRHNVYC